jgi:hypothetical protein
MSVALLNRFVDFSPSERKLRLNVISPGHLLTLYSGIDIDCCKSGCQIVNRKLRAACFDKNSRPIDLLVTAKTELLCIVPSAFHDFSCGS